MADAMSSQANVTCTPSTPAPARKRRRPNQDLQERLARCEALLKQYAGGGPPPAAQVQKSHKPQSQPQPQATLPTPQATLPTPQPAAIPSENHGRAAPQDPPPAAEAPDQPLSKAHAGKMIQDEGGVRFVDNRLWTSFYDEVRTRFSGGFSCS